jgi:hypothetical protein
MMFQGGNMKKILVFALIMGLVTAGLFAEDALNIPEPTATSTPVPADTQSNLGWQAFRITFDVDFATVGMEQANDSMNTAVNISKFFGGFIGTLDLGIAVYPFLFVGPKTGYLFCFPASFENVIAGPLNLKTSRDAVLIPVELGAALRFGVPFTNNITISTSAYAGIGIVRITDNVDVTRPGEKTSYVQSFSGLGFSGEWNVAVEIKLMKGVDFNVNGGYRIAGVPNVSQDAAAYYAFAGDPSTQVGNKGDKLKDAASINVPFDFSGLNIGVGISMGY